MLIWVPKLNKPLPYKYISLSPPYSGLGTYLGLYESGLFPTLTICVIVPSDTTASFIFIENIFLITFHFFCNCIIMTIPMIVKFYTIIIICKLVFIKTPLHFMEFGFQVQRDNTTTYFYYNIYL